MLILGFGFSLAIVPILMKGEKLMVAVEEVKEVEKADLSEVKQYGELWVKDCEFNAKGVEVKAYTLINSKGTRKLTFQTYNGTFGAKNKKPPFKQFNVGRAGHDVEDVEKVREELKKKGYRASHR